MGRHGRYYPLDPRGTEHRAYLFVSYHRGGAGALRERDTGDMCGAYAIGAVYVHRVRRLTPGRKLLALMLTR